MTTTLEITTPKTLDNGEPMPEKVWMGTTGIDYASCTHKGSKGLACFLSECDSNCWHSISREITCLAWEITLDEAKAIARSEDLWCIHFLDRYEVVGTLDLIAD